jgi:tRNA U38,U39,U40 pseudouridine synthase TruA
VAVLLEVGLGRLAAEDAAALLDRPGRALHGRAAPPRGLTLERIVYPSAITNRRTGLASPNGGRGSSNRKTGEQ